MRKPRSECTERQLDLAVTRLIDGTYKSASKAIIAMGISISPQGLLKRRRKIEALAIDSAISPAPKEAQAPTERDRIEALKEASRRVECAQKKHGNKRKKTASIICEMKAEYPGAALLSMSNMNRHVQIGRAGQSPAKAKKPRILSPEGESALVKYVLEADAMMLLLNQDELKDAYTDLVEGTNCGEKLKNNKPSRGATRALLSRHKDTLQAEFPQNMEPARAKWTTYENINAWYEVCKDTYVAADIAELNPKYDSTNPDTDEIIITKPGSIGSCDEMPAWLNLNTGQKSGKDKKLTTVRPQEAKSKAG